VLARAIEEKSRQTRSYFTDFVSKQKVRIILILRSCVPQQSRRMELMRNFYSSSTAVKEESPVILILVVQKIFPLRLAAVNLKNAGRESNQAQPQ
jgi:hypothetical protein